MKKILFSLLFCWPAIAFGQDSINPYNTQLPANIILHYTDVYYYPMAPPASTDIRGYLSTVSDILRDPNGAGDFYRNYLPMTHDTLLENWHPYGGAPLGRGALWQRFFTARDKWNHTHSDITAGGYRHDSVIISKNEDVDFRASGTVKLENGFHAKPGCFFHAYQEPRWGPTVFKDDFDSTKLDRSKWYVMTGSDVTEGVECSTDSNAIMDTDYQATDGHALDVVLREVPDTCSCRQLLPDWDRADTVCDSLIDPNRHDPQKLMFSSAILISCPYPYLGTDTPLTPAYQHAPYGKYEVREKIPHIIHHTNNWGTGANIEYDMNESWSAGEIHPSIGTYVDRGPAKGVFKKIGDTAVFICPSAHFSSNWIRPVAIMINNFWYDIAFRESSEIDTLLAGPGTKLHGGWPSSIVNSTDSTTFYYQQWPDLAADTVTWKVTQDSNGKWRIFSAPYRILSPGDSLRFTKSYQPVQLTLTYDLAGDKKTIICWWDSAMNTHAGDTGYLWLNDTLAPSDLHSNTERYQFSVSDLYRHGYSYGEAQPTYWDTTDPNAYWKTPYKYHTFAMEWLPNEVRFLLDSNVIRRMPDRMIPPGSPYFDWATHLPRGPANIRPGEFCIDYSGTDTLGVDDTIAYIIAGDTAYNSSSYAERHYFEEHVDSCAGCWPVTIGSHTYKAAHHKVDYVKIWDVPSDMKISDYPH